MNSHARFTKQIAATLAIILGVSGVALTATTASAAVEPTVTIGTPTGAGVVDGVVTTESAVTVPITISGFGAATKLDVKISVPVGEGYFSVDPGTTAIASDVGYTDRTEVTEYAFNGTVADVTSVLAEGVTWVAPATSTGDITVSVAQTETGLYYNHANGHYYKPVNDNAVTWGEAVDRADNTTKYGMVGYLATVTSRQENDFITYNTTTDSMWLGGSDSGGSNGSSYTWRTGPESGQQFWSGNDNGSVSNGMYAGWQLGEPSNTRYFWNFGFSNDYENNTVINWEQRGRWNDLMNDPRNRDFNDDQVNWYLIEYGGMGSDAPTALIAEDTATLDASDTIRSGTISGGTFTEGIITAAWANTDSKSFAIDLQRFTNTSASQLVVSLSLPANSGTFTVPVTTGLTLETGYSSFTAQPEIGFVGAKSAVIAALENLQWNPPATFGEVTASVSVAEKEPGIFYNPDNGHYYQVKTWGGNTSVSSASSFASAQTFAGMSGYLATITTEAENDFIADYTTAANAWIGATDDTSYVNNVSDQRYDDREGSWHWFTGPEAGREFWYGESGGSTRNGLFENWASGEPNNEPRNLFDSVGEDFAVTNFNGAIGFWNDALNDANGVNAAIIEYGGMPTEPNKSKAAASTVTFLHAIEPDAPTLSDVDAGDESVSATFTDGDDNGESITARQYTLDGGTTWVGATLDAGTLSVDGLVNGETYDLCIRAANTIGYSESSDCVNVTPATVPDAPVLSDLRPRENGLRGTVDAGASDGGTQVTSWEYKLDAGNWIEFADDVTFDGYVRIESGLTNGQEYTVCVRAANAEGTSLSSNCETVTPDLASEPGSPAITAVVVDETSATVTIAEPSDGGADLTLFEYSLDDGATWSEAPDPSVPPRMAFAVGIRSVPDYFSVGVTQTWVIAELSPGRSYALKVRVTNDAGFSATSSVYRFTTTGDGSSATGGLAFTGLSLNLNLALAAVALVLLGALLRSRKNQFGIGS
jgi:hypothetical protein